MPRLASRTGPRAPRTASRLLDEWGRGGAALVALLIGGVYLVAWLTGLAAHWSATGVQTMKTNMSASLVLAGAALLLVAPASSAPLRRGVAVLLGSVVFLIGLLTLAEHVLHADLGIDQLLATEPPGAVVTTSPNRLGLPGSVSLTLLGAGLVALARRHRAASLLALAVAVVVLVPAVGFLFGIAPLYREPAVTAIAWPTVIALSAVSAGIVLAQGRAGPLALVWRDDAGGRLLRQALPTAILGPLALQVVMRFGERLGLYGHATGVGILLISFIVTISALLWRSASHLSAVALQTERAQHEARWRADLLDLVHDAILVWSDETGIEAWSGGAVATYGYAVAEAFGRNPHELLRTVFPRPLGEIADELRRHRHWEGELRHRTKDGREVVVSSKLRMVRGVDGSERVLETNRDISNRKRMEDELRDSSRRKDEFLRVLSHELRNPLAPITNSLYVLERAEPTGEQARRAKAVIGRQVGHLARLVDDLLEITRISTGKIELHRTRLDVSGAVRRTGEDHRALLDARGVEYAIHIPDEAVWVDGDETRLAQVIGNLLQNAAKFTPPGGRVNLSVDVDEETVEVRVRDTGAGIEPGLIERVFEPFVQAEQTLARTDGGLGLGLALVKALIELHGGSVRAISAGRGRGAEFVIRLPTIAPSHPEAPDPARIERVPPLGQYADPAYAGRR